MSDAIVKHIPYSVDLNEPVKKTYIDTLLATEDNLAHCFDISLVRGAEAVALPDGTAVTAYFIRYSDNATVPIKDGSISGNVASITLTKGCYNKPGQFALIIKVSGDGGIKNTVFYGEGTVFASSTDTIVDEENVVPSLSDLLAQIEAMETATEAAKTATTNAKSATTKANNATTNANNAAAKIDGLTVSAESSETAGATISEVNGVKHIYFALPTGATPDITFKVATGAAGTDVQIEQSGTAENPVVKLTIPRGDTGAIENLTVNGVASDESGNILVREVFAINKTKYLTAQDDFIGVMASDADGNSYSIRWGGTEESLPVFVDSFNGYRGAFYGEFNKPSPADIGALASDGTAADSAKLGGKDAKYYIQPRNLLDNSDFTIPVNQRGQTSYEGFVYSIDRWMMYKADGSSKVSIASDGIHVETPSLFQKLSLGLFKAGEIYTFAVCDVNENIFIVSATCGEKIKSEDDALELSLENADDRGFYEAKIMKSGTYKWAALYEGEYTAENLPPYVPKGYNAELYECQRYFQRHTFYQYETIGLAYQGPEYCFINLPLKRSMRIKNTSLSHTGGAITIGNGVYSGFNGATSADASVCIVGQNYATIANPAGPCYCYTLNAVGTCFDISADL